MLMACAGTNKTTKHPSAKQTTKIEKKKEMSDGVFFLLAMGAGSFAIAGLGALYDKNGDALPAGLIYSGAGVVFLSSAGILYLIGD